MFSSSFLKTKTTLLLATALALATAGCEQLAPEPDADVIIVGAGIAGLAAALEASAQGASVLIIEVNSVGGGHAVKAGGLAMVDTALQRQKGIKDSPDLAWADLLRWGEDPDPYWSRRYVEESSSEVYDWLTDLGVEFVVVLDTPEDTVPRFHFTRGAAVNVVIPMLSKALQDPNIAFKWNTRVSGLTRKLERIAGVATTNERTGSKQLFTADNIILATGGFQNNLAMVRSYWPANRAEPEKLLKGAGQFAGGDGYRMAEWAGAAMLRMDRQVTFYQGVQNPRDESGMSAFFGQNPAAIWLDHQGRRFVNEAADSKTIETAVNNLQPINFWMVFDAAGSRRFGVRGSPWLNSQTIRHEILDNPTITHKASSLDQLATLTGMSAHKLRATVQVWNRMLDVGTDYQFARFTAEAKVIRAKPVHTPPYYAVRMHPLTRKSMGGPAINIRGQVIDSKGEVIPGLYAAGELTGVAGINGSHGGAGTFLGPSVLTGRVAGKQAALSSKLSARHKFKPFPKPTGDVPNYGLDGYWHYDVVHRLASEWAYTCDDCHSEQMPMTMAHRPVEMLTRLNTCTDCH